MTDNTKLEAALAENPWVRRPDELKVIEDAAREYLAQQRPVSDDAAKALYVLHEISRVETEYGRPVSYYYEEEIETIRSLLTQQRWMPIDTAPKKDWEFGVILLPEDESSIGFWSDTDKSWCRWYKCCHYAPKVEPTHWMPLPPAPTSTAKQSASHKENEK